MIRSTTGGDLLAAALASLGVTEVFTLHGGHLDSFLVACADAGIRLTDTRHEASAGHAADGYARARGGALGVCVTTAGPGFTNSLTAITNAFVDGVPVLFISGSPPLREAETNPLQGGFDQVAMAAPVTKWSHRVTHTERIPDLVRQGARTALSGRPGPVFLEFPIDVMFAPAPRLEQIETRRPGSHVAEPSRPAPTPAELGEALRMLAEAERPVIIAGAGSVLSPAAEALDQFAAASGVPVVTNSKAHGVLAPDHPQYCGPAGVLAAAGLTTGKAPDLVILLGARMGMFTGGRGGAIIPHAAKVIQIDIEGAEIGRIRQVELPIAADASSAMAALLSGVHDQSWPDWSGWTATLRGLNAQRGEVFRSAPPMTASGFLHPYHAVGAVFEALSPDTIVIADGGEAGAWVAEHAQPRGPGAFMTCGYLGCLGVAPGFAIGAARARPGLPVVSFTGDGALGLNVQEFDTMVRHQLPILTVVLNNSCWGMSQSGQDLVFGRNRRAAVALRHTDYDKVAAGFGAYGERIQDIGQIKDAVRRAQASGLPACLNLITDPELPHPVTAVLVGDISGESSIPIPYYDNIPL